MSDWNCDQQGCRLFKDIPINSLTWMSHGDEVVEVPPGFRVTARSSNGAIAALCACPEHPVKECHA